MLNRCIIFVMPCFIITRHYKDDTIAFLQVAQDILTEQKLTQLL